MKELKDKVTCEICNREFEKMTSTHLNKHNISFKKYKEMFPNSETMGRKEREYLDSKEYKEKRSKITKKFHNSLTEKEKEIRINKMRLIEANKTEQQKKERSEKFILLNKNKTPERKQENSLKQSKGQKRYFSTRSVEEEHKHSERAKRVHKNRNKKDKEDLYKKVSESQKKYIAITGRIKGKFMTPNIGKNETKALDMMESKLNINITRQYRVLHYFVDGYDEINNVVYEVYEHRHYTKKNMKKDEIRMNNIIKELNCGFVIINDDQKVIY